MQSELIARTVRNCARALLAAADRMDSDRELLIDIVVADSWQHRRRYARALYGLRRHGVETVGQLLNTPDEELLRLHLVGPKSLADLRRVVQEARNGPR